jgi:hypothetical protein
MAGPLDRALYTIGFALDLVLQSAPRDVHESVIPVLLRGLSDARGRDKHATAARCLLAQILACVVLGKGDRFDPADLPRIHESLVELFTVVCWRSPVPVALLCEKHVNRAREILSNPTISVISSQLRSFAKQIVDIADAEHRATERAKVEETEAGEKSPEPSAPGSLGLQRTGYFNGLSRDIAPVLVSGKAEFR